MRERGTMRKYDIKYREKRDTKIGREPGKTNYKDSRIGM
jgi:hypothetical protein